MKFTSIFFTASESIFAIYRKDNSKGWIMLICFIRAIINFSLIMAQRSAEFFILF